MPFARDDVGQEPSAFIAVADDLLVKEAWVLVEQDVADVENDGPRFQHDVRGADGRFSPGAP